MPRHARTQQVQLARIDISRKIIESANAAGLTYVETVQAITDALELLSKHALRAERHPNGPDKGADEAF